MNEFVEEDSDEMGVEDRADLVLNAIQFLDLSMTKVDQLCHVIYTLSEAGVIEDMEVETALKIWGLVELVKDGRYTEDMRL